MQEQRTWFSKKKTLTYCPNDAPHEGLNKDNSWINLKTSENNPDTNLSLHQDVNQNKRRGKVNKQSTDLNKQLYIFCYAAF